VINMDTFERSVFFISLLVILYIMFTKIDSNLNKIEAQLNTIQMQTAHAEFFTQPIPHKQSDIKLKEK